MRDMKRRLQDSRPQGALFDYVGPNGHLRTESRATVAIIHRKPASGQLEKLLLLRDKLKTPKGAGNPLRGFT
jgi:hypothetical protein